MSVESELSQRAPAPDLGEGDPTGVGPTPVPPLAANGGGPTPAESQPQPQVQARRVRRILRRIDPWSVLKVSFIFSVCMYAVAVVSSVLVWRAAVSSEIVDDVEGFVVDLGFSDFQFAPEQMFRALLYGGAVMIVVATFLAVLMTVLFNLISDLVGGIRVSMIEQQVLDRQKQR